MARMLVRHKLPARAAHSMHALIFLVLVLSGIVIIAPPFNFLAFGYVRYALLLHRYASLAFLGLPLLAAIIAGRDLSGFLKVVFQRFDEDDKKWLKRFALYIFKPSIDMPKQGIIQAGARLGMILMMTFVILLMVSGLAMWFPGTLPDIVMRWAQPLHEIGIFGLAIVMFFHFYFGFGLFAPYRGFWRLMFGDGLVEYEKAEALWPKWTEDQLKR